MHCHLQKQSCRARTYPSWSSLARLLHQMCRYKWSWPAVGQLLSIGSMSSAEMRLGMGTAQAANSFALIWLLLNHCPSKAPYVLPHADVITDMAASPI